MEAEESWKKEEFVALVEDDNNGLLVEAEMKESPAVVRGFQTNPDEQQPRICIALSILFLSNNQKQSKGLTVENDDGIGLEL